MLALITGRGGLPAAVVNSVSLRPLICVLDGHIPKSLTPDISFRIENLGTLISTLRNAGITELCFCGAVDRPKIDLSKVDEATSPFLSILAGAVARGEDSSLRAIIGIFEKSGFKVRGAHELAPDLLPPLGVLTITPLPQQAHSDVKLALTAITTNTKLDLGQSCIIRDGSVLAVEDTRGTDAMLEDVKISVEPTSAEPHDPFFGMMDIAGGYLENAADWLSGQVEEKNIIGGMLFKTPKVNQDFRIDLPTIGPDTVEKAIEARLGGIVISHGDVLVLDKNSVIEKLNDAGMYLWVR
ncbi:MAG: UDP-2,3-diacylglucosamine diphosphatase LpxI [Tateyamaria sp.]|nr:UDP-2,3-diacylglucosamine diphosphatase LpxI [Tateyamaria sp.]MDG0982605.1 UDP-2,3-diacylglucosamine diphosphatase LpxI [Tateyamaria sp.]MDG1419783.1 UDP-2,3-diacylglucosamine diphosphatase LpxI [Tateyamaria sp.]MDG2377715.1 UDP-2,3-diacylglucosamine diphosphatase LpxI [Tateyamaria sp.]